MKALVLVYIGGIASCRKCEVRVYTETLDGPNGTEYVALVCPRCGAERRVG